MNLAEYYWWFESVIPEILCDEIIKYGNLHNKKLATTGNFTDEKLNKEQEEKLKKERNSNVVFLDEAWIYKEIQPYIYVANRNAHWDFQWQMSETCQFTTYGPNQHYDWHCDSFKKPYDKPPFRKGLIRKLSMTLSLTDPKEYEGGEFQFDFRDKKDKNIITCKEVKKKGSIVVFPSFVWHRVTPVTKGIRNSLVCWNLGKPYV